MESGKKICCIYNYAQHYRLPIFQLLNDRLNVHFYFGRNSTDIKSFDYKLLSNFKKELKPINIKNPIYWLKGSVNLCFNKYDHFLILGEYFCLSTWAILILNKIIGNKTYLWSHGYYGNENYLKQKVKKLFYSLATTNLLYGGYAKELMIKDGINPTKMDVIFNSLNFKEQSDIYNSLKNSAILKDYFGNSNKTLIYIGRLQKRKKINLLIEAVSLLKQEGKCVNLLLLGDGECESNLKELAQNLLVSDHVWFYGSLYNEEKIGQLLYDSEICISPGNVGLTAMHSLVYGTPVITHGNFKNQMPEFESITPGKNGDFFEENNLNDLVKTISNWLEEHNDREFTRNECRKVIETKYNPENQFKIIKQIIDENSN